MEISDDLLCLFTAEIEEGDESTVVRIPEHEIDIGTIDPDESYRIAIFEAATSTTSQSAPEPSEQTRDSPAGGDHPEPPVEEGETLDVEIESLGEQGDGIARVERGFVVIVPDTDKGERVTAEITDVKSTVAFGEVVERYHPKID